MAGAGGPPRTVPRVGAGRGAEGGVAGPPATGRAADGELRAIAACLAQLRAQLAAHDRTVAARLVGAAILAIGAGARPGR
jgi:hypothetical protein